MRRTLVALLTALLIVALPHGEAASMPIPTPAEAIDYFGFQLDYFGSAYEAGDFGEIRPEDLERFDELAAQLDAIDPDGGAAADAAIGQFIMRLVVFLQELATRDGADPVLVQEVGMIASIATGPMPVGAPVAPVATQPVTTPPVTVPATAPQTVPVTAAPVATSVPVTAPPVTVAPATQPPSTVAVVAERTAAGGSRGITINPLHILAVIAAVAIVAIASYAGPRWYRSRLPKPTGRPGFHDLMDVSRRLAGAGSGMEVEEMAVRQAMRLTAARSGAFVRHRERRLSVGFETDDGLLVGERLRDGLLDRVVGAGHEVMQISATEPSIRNLPASILAAPVFVGGVVHGTVVLVRPVDDPFTDDDLRMLTDLKPIFGAAFEQVQHTEQVRAEALADGLTGVRNRRALDLAIADRGAAPFAAVMVDLDHFKTVNDTHGHQAGDDLLRSVANRLVANVRPGDEVYRYGGEEFAVVLPDTHEETAAEVAERVRIALEATPFLVGPARIEHRATASLGVASGTDGTAVFGRADQALYEAKRSGRNRVVIAAPAPAL